MSSTKGTQQEIFVCEIKNNLYNNYITTIKDVINLSGEYYREEDG